ncbi:MAG: Lrp/AsnC family transcriptional regulator [Acidimicrobiales bacterium]
MINAFVLIDAEPARVADLAQQLTDLAGVSEVYSVTGDDDLVVIVRVKEHDELAEVVTREIASLDGIRCTRTMVAYKAYSKHDLDAIFDVGR